VHTSVPISQTNSLQVNFLPLREPTYESGSPSEQDSCHNQSLFQQHPPPEELLEEELEDELTIPPELEELDELDGAKFAVIVQLLLIDTSLIVEFVGEFSVQLGVGFVDQDQFVNV
jgi:hypothetical protein